jgi:Domain of unknown function (DUF4258)
VTKPIHFSDHVLEQMLRRGVSIDDIAGAIRTEPWRRGRTGWFECRKNVPCRRWWDGVLCDTRQVRVLFAEERDRLVVVTAYGYLVRTSA